MKLFVWCDPYRVSYGNSMVMAVAEDEDAAKEIAMAAPQYKYGQYKQDATSYLPLGKPTRVVDLPCAEWHEWSE